MKGILFYPLFELYLKICAYHISWNNGLVLHGCVPLRILFERKRIEKSLPHHYTCVCPEYTTKLDHLYAHAFCYREYLACEAEVIVIVSIQFLH